jgi:hypothetical protein
MSAIDRVLFASDFLASWRMPPVVWQIMMLRSCAEVTLLHVLDSTWNSGRDNKLERAVARMDVVARQDLPGVRVVRRIERGREVDRILECIRTNQIDLVVHPARTLCPTGQSPFSAAARHVFREAPCAVWLDCVSVPPNLQDSLRGRPICCSVDGGEADEYVLQEAAQLASDLGARLTIIYQLWAETGKTTALFCDPHARGREVQTAEVRMDRLRRRFAPGADLRVEVGIKESVLSQAIRRLNAGLLVAASDDAAAILAAEPVCPVWRLPQCARSFERAPKALAACAGQERRIA